jgi:TonB family protein
MRRSVAGAAFGVLAAVLMVVAQDTVFEPAQYRAGTLPVLPTTAVGGGEVLLDVAVDVRGDVTGVTPLRATPPFTGMFANAVQGWSFRPARDLGIYSPSHVLVAVVVRPPALTFPSTHGEPPQDVAVPRAELPVPVTLAVPAYPPMAHRSGVVLIEARIDTAGHVTRVRVMQSAPPFDSAASEAAWRCTFRPARVRGTPAVSLVYLAFGFPEIVTSH